MNWIKVSERLPYYRGNPILFFNPTKKGSKRWIISALPILQVEFGATHWTEVEPPDDIPPLQRDQENSA
jgi:hypothetical protein